MRPGSSVVTPEVVEALADLSPAAVRLAVALGHHANGAGQCWPGRETLMRLTGIRSVATIAAGMRELELCGLRRLRRHHKPTLYSWPKRRPSKVQSVE